MGQRWQTIDGLRLVFHPAENPFLSLLLKRAKYQPEPFLKRQTIALTFVGIASLIALVVVELLEVPLLLKGGWLLEAVVISHLLAASGYTSAVTKLLEQFWWEKNRHDLLLTGVPAVWLVLARKFCRIVFSAHFALLCLPFYAAAFAWGVSARAILIPLVLAVIGSRTIAALAFICLFGWFYATASQPTVMPFWVNVPFLLTQPMGFFVWTVPAWLLVTVTFVLLTTVSMTAEAWELEERPIPSQLKVLRWRGSFGLLLFVSLWGAAWAYLPVSYIAKVAFSLCASRLLFSIVAISLVTSMKRYLDPTSHPMLAFLSVLALDGIVLAGCIFFGMAEGQGSIVFKVALVGFLLSVVNATSYVLGFNGWQRLLTSSPNAILLLFWFLSPTALLVGSYAPQFSWVGALAGVQGWLVPLSMAGTMKLPFTIAGFNQIVFPPWWLMATVQLAWSGLLFLVGRKTAPVAEVEPVTLTADHPIFGWIVRLEDKMMEKWDNALVNVQLRWQRRHIIGWLRFAFALSLLGFVVAAVTLLTPLRILLPNLLFATPILLCVFTFPTATQALLWYELKHDLSRWGRLRIMEQIVLTRLTAKQIRFGLWFPRFWLAIKIIAIPLISAWLIALPQPFVLPTKFGLWLLIFMALATFVTPLFFFAASLFFSGVGLAGHDPLSCLTILLLVLLMPIIWLIQMFFQHGLNLSYATILAFGLTPLLLALISAILLLPLGFRYLRDVDKLKTAKGYEEWLKRTEEIARKRERQG